MRALVIAVSAVVLLLGFTQGAAAGESAAVSVTSVPTAVNKHCLKNLDTDEQTCFARYSDVLARQTSTRELPVYHLVTFFDWINYDDRGGTYTVSRNKACTTPRTDVDHYDPTMVDEGWNDRVSSVQTFNSCDVWFFKDTGALNSCPGGWIDKSPHLGQQGCYDVASSWKLS